VQSVHVVSFDAVEAQLQAQAHTSEFDVAAWRQVVFSLSLSTHVTSLSTHDTPRDAVSSLIAQARVLSFESVRRAAASASPSHRTLIIADDTMHLTSMRRSLWSVARDCAAAIRCNPCPRSAPPFCFSASGHK
jgi:hypothetical protein